MSHLWLVSVLHIFSGFPLKWSMVRCQQTRYVVDTCMGVVPGGPAQNFIKPEVWRARRPTFGLSQSCYILYSTFSVRNSCSSSSYVQCRRTAQLVNNHLICQLLGESKQKLLTYAVSYYFFTTWWSNGPCQA